ncbi:MAG: lipid A biosynthesis acyltransferase [Burkholderiaceae bacterium]|nr:lipid A biosynthesis acyltransferase [Burkholderiaceae bacterium]
MSKLGAYLVIGLMRLLAVLPLSWVRALGWLLGRVLFYVVKSRRHVATVNLTLCFPDHSEQQIRRLVRQNFIYFVQAWLDRGWLWHGSAAVTLRRLKITGAIHELQNDEPVVLFVPHFVGLDAANTAFTQQIQRNLITIYTNQANQTIDAWVLKQRGRFGNVRLFGRIAGVKEIVTALRSGEMLGLLPDMNFGPEESVFVPFYGVQACTVPSLSRFARLGRAKVVPVLSRMAQDGYEVEVLTAWQNFPTDDVVADTALMNQRLQGYINTMPAQYFWVHKRFKDRPAGEKSVY